MPLLRKENKIIGDKLFDFACRFPIRYRLGEKPVELLINPNNLQQPQLTIDGVSIPSKLSIAEKNIYRQLMANPDGRGLRLAGSVSVEINFSDFGAVNFSLFQFIPISVLGLNWLPKVFPNRQIIKTKLEGKEQINLRPEANEKISSITRLMNCIVMWGIVERRKNLPE